MAYVDLNPIRAKIDNTPENSNYTAIKQRINLIKKNKKTPSPLEHFVGIQEKTIGIPYRLMDYLELVDWTGRIIREDKRGFIAVALPNILQRLDIDREAWTTLTTEFETQFSHWVGSEHIVRQVCADKAYQRIPSTASHRRLLG